MAAVIFFKSMYEETRKALAACSECLLADKTRPAKIPMQHWEITQPGECVFIDVLSLAPVTDPTTNQVTSRVLLIVDQLTGFLMAVPLYSLTGSELATTFERNWLSIFSKPRLVASDLGTNLTSETFQDLLRRYQIKFHASPSRHYMGHGRVECMCKMVSTTLRRMLQNDQNSWLQKLPEAVAAINSTCTTVSGVSAFEAFLARSPNNAIAANLPKQTVQTDMTDTLEKRKENAKIACDLIKEKTEQNQKQNDKYYKHEVKEKEFQVGDRALLYTDKSSKKGVVDKLTYSYRRVIIDKKLPNNAYKLIDATTQQSIPYHFHANRLVHDHITDGIKNDATQKQKLSFADRKLLRAAKISNDANSGRQKTAVDCADCPTTRPSNEPANSVQTNGSSFCSDASTVPTAAEQPMMDGEGRSAAAADESTINHDDQTALDAPAQQAAEQQKVTQQKRIVYNSCKSTDDWYPIKKILSRSRKSDGTWLYKVQWDTEEPTYSYLPASDLSKTALDVFYKRLRRHRRRN